MISSSIRIAATADLHIRTGDDLAYLREAFAYAADAADVMLIAGDLVDVGRLAEMEYLAEVLAEIPIPVFTVLGNHDRRGMRRAAMIKVLRDVGVRNLDGTGALVQIAGKPTLGVVGVTGTGGSFTDDESDQIGAGARFTRAARIKSRKESARLRRALRELALQEPDVTVVMTHFSPTTTTLGGEPPLKYWMLGNALLGKTIDEAQPTLAIHGHAHLGNEVGQTEGGTVVRNVAVPVCGGIRLFDASMEEGLTEIGLIPVAFDATRGGMREAVTYAE